MTTASEAAPVTAPTQESAPAEQPVLTVADEPADPTPAEPETPASDNPDPETAPSAEVAVPDNADVATTDDQWVHQSEWSHQWLDFHGDKLAIRTPKGAALNALGAARHNGLEFQDKMVNLFVAKHLSPETYERVMFRMIDPDDEAFQTEQWGELINAIAETGAERLQADAEALAEVANKGK